MGFFFRKSVRFGPVRLNFSKSGIGVSTGVKGARISTGPRGTYISLGRNGIYYRKKIGPSRTPASRNRQQAAVNQDLQYQEIATANATKLVDSSASEFTQQLNEAHRKVAFAKMAVILGVISFFVGIGTSGFLVLALLLFIAAIPIRYWDKQRKTVHLNFDLDDELGGAYREFCEAVKLIGTNKRIWQIQSKAYTNDLKRNAGASRLLKRVQIKVTSKVPYITSNLPLYAIRMPRQILYFVPDRLIVVDRKSVGTVSYKELSIKVAPTRFIESGAVPSDATQIDTTWKYLNKNGSPDRRFSNNKRLPVMRYGEITLTSPQGLHYVLNVSNDKTLSRLNQAFLDIVSLTEHIT